MNSRMVIVWAMLWSPVLLLTGCQCDGKPIKSAPIVPPAGALDLTTLPPLTPKPAGTSATVFIKVVIDKEYGILAHLLGGKRDSTWRSTTYDPAEPWWNNPLIAYREAPLLHADAIGRADAQVITGQGSSGNVTIKLTLVPHADVSVRTIPRSDGVKGTLTTTISAAAEYYDGEWVEMVHETDRNVTFSFDTCDPLERLEAVEHETRTIPAFALERYTRDREKWEPGSDWPATARSGDWRVVIYAREAELRVTGFRYVNGSGGGIPR